MSIYGDSIRTTSSLYLTRCTANLYSIFLKALSLEEVKQISKSKDEDTHEEYIEARRLASERYFFARNPKLVKRAKEIHGYKCQVCDFDFFDRYGSLGKKFIEAHQETFGLVGGESRTHTDSFKTSKIKTYKEEVNWKNGFCRSERLLNI